MAQNVSMGDTVYVPCSKFDELANNKFSIYRTTVVGVQNRTIQVNLPGQEIGKISLALVHKNVGILILTIGDLRSEENQLYPLSKSILQFTRLLIEDGAVASYQIRSLAELDLIWGNQHAKFSHVVLIGHGSQHNLHFGVDGDVSPFQLAEILNIRGAEKKVFISLCCQTGYKSFARPFSRIPLCVSFIAPFHSIHSAEASQFFQSFMTYNLLMGYRTKVSYNKAAESIAGKSKFRLWEGGRLVHP